MLQPQSGSRCMIDQFLLSAVVYAQSIIDHDPQLKAQLCKRYRILDPHITIFTDVDIPDGVEIAYRETMFLFYGPLDYAMGFVNAKDVRKNPFLSV